MFLSPEAWKKTVIGIDNEDMARFGLEFLVEAMHNLMELSPPL